MGYYICPVKLAFVIVFAFAMNGIVPYFGELLDGRMAHSFHHCFRIKLLFTTVLLDKLVSKLENGSTTSITLKKLEQYQAQKHNGSGTDFLLVHRAFVYLA